MNTNAIDTATKWCEMARSAAQSLEPSGGCECDTEIGWVCQGCAAAAVLRSGCGIMRRLIKAMGADVVPAETPVKPLTIDDYWHDYFVYCMRKPRPKQIEYTIGPGFKSVDLVRMPTADDVWRAVNGEAG
jgi:hypothetical protein